MNNEVKVTKLEIQIGSKTIELSVEDARKLQDALNDIFKQAANNITVIDYQKYTQPYPHITWCSDQKTNDNNIPNSTPKIICQSETLTYSC